MSTTTSTEVHDPRAADPARSSGPTKSRGLIWLAFMLAIVGVSAYAVWRAGQPNTVQAGTNDTGRGGRGGGRGRGGTGPVPVVVSQVGRSSIPVVLNGLGNVTAF